MKRYVYIVEAEGLDRVKIGTSVRPQIRLINMQVGSPVKLHLIAVRGFIAADEIEALLHHRLKDYHLHGEWFDLSVDRAIKILEDFDPRPLAKQSKTVRAIESYLERNP